MGYANSPSFFFSLSSHLFSPASASLKNCQEGVNQSCERIKWSQPFEEEALGRHAFYSSMRIIELLSVG